MTADNRYPMIDSIIENDTGERAIALKNVSGNDPIFGGVRLDEPMEMPAPAVIDALIQTSVCMLNKRSHLSGQEAEFVGVEAFSIQRPVLVGHQLRMEVEVLPDSVSGIRVQVVGVVNGQVTAEGILLFKLGTRLSRQQIHPTASIHPSAVLGKNVVVGPYTIIGPHVIIGDNTIIEAHVMIDTWTQIGEDCHIFFGSVIGSAPQDLKYKGEFSQVVVGNKTILREYVTINRATGHGNVTKIGDECLFLTNVHVGHNCHIGNRVVITNLTHLGGHTTVEDNVVIGGIVGVHQFVRIGRGAMVGGYSRLPQDVPPFTLVEGNPAYVRGLNLVGLRRSGIPLASIQSIKSVYKTVFRSGLNTSQAMDAIQEMALDDVHANYLVQFLKSSSKRGYTRSDGVSEPPDDGGC